MNIQRRVADPDLELFWSDPDFYTAQLEFFFGFSESAKSGTPPEYGRGYQRDRGHPHLSVSELHGMAGRRCMYQIVTL